MTQPIDVRCQLHERGVGRPLDEFVSRTLKKVKDEGDWADECVVVALCDIAEDEYDTLMRLIPRDVTAKRMARYRGDDGEVKESIAWIGWNMVFVEAAMMGYAQEIGLAHNKTTVVKIAAGANSAPTFTPKNATRH